MDATRKTNVSLLYFSGLPACMFYALYKTSLYERNITVNIVSKCLEVVMTNC